MNKKDILVTERCILRKVKKEDASPMFSNWASDKEVTKYLTWPTHESVEVTNQIIDYWLEEEHKPNTHRFMITLKGNDEPIGSIDVVKYIEGVPEIGYCLSRKYWNKGYMSEVCKAFVDYLFELGFNKILIEAAEDNIGSNRIIQKCGFSFTHKINLEHHSALKNDPIVVNCYEIRK